MIAQVIPNMILFQKVLPPLNFFRLFAYNKRAKGSWLLYRPQADAVLRRGLFWEGTGQTTSKDSTESFHLSGCVFNASKSLLNKKQLKGTWLESLDRVVPGSSKNCRTTSSLSFPSTSIGSTWVDDTRYTSLITKGWPIDSLSIIVCRLFRMFWWNSFQFCPCMAGRCLKGLKSKYASKLSSPCLNCPWDAHEAA